MRPVMMTYLQLIQIHILSHAPGEVTQPSLLLAEVQVTITVVQKTVQRPVIVQQPAS